MEKGLAGVKGKKVIVICRKKMAGTEETCKHAWYRYYAWYGVLEAFPPEYVSLYKAVYLGYVDNPEEAMQKVRERKAIEMFERVLINRKIVEEIIQVQG